MESKSAKEDVESDAGARSLFSNATHSSQPCIENALRYRAAALISEALERACPCSCLPERRWFWTSWACRLSTCRGNTSY
eukprot:54569-Eustigmatos_ZCMA.PRE.1